MKSGSNLSGRKVQRERETGEERGRLSRMSKTVWLHLHLAPFLIVDIKLHQNFTFDGWRRGQITTEEKSKMLAGVLRHASGILRAVLHLLTQPQREETVIIFDFWETDGPPAEAPCCATVY